MGVLAWHFVGKTLQDGSPIPPDGVKLKYDGKIKMCESCYHASIDAFDALQYAPGDTLCRVYCDGEVIMGDDKLDCSERTIIQRMDATEMLLYFARMQALSVIHLYPNGTDDVVFDYLMTGDEAIKYAARAAARAAASAAAWDAARAAASAAAWAAASAAAWDAARAAASAAASAAARKEFNSLVNECFGIKE